METPDYEIISDDEKGVTARFADQEKATLARVGLLMSGINAPLLGITSRDGAEALKGNPEVHVDGMDKAAFAEIYGNAQWVIPELQTYARSKNIILAAPDFKFSDSMKMARIRFELLRGSHNPDSFKENIRTATKIRFDTYDLGNGAKYALETYALPSENLLGRLRILIETYRRFSSKGGVKTDDGINGR